MSRTLFWTAESKKSFDQNLEYLAKEWNNQIMNNFLDRVEEVLEQIVKNPQLYSLHRPADHVYKCVVHKRDPPGDVMNIIADFLLFVPTPLQRDHIHYI